MSAKRVCQVLAVLSWLFAGFIIFRRELGHGLFPEDEHSDQLGPVTLFILLLGLLVLMAGAIAELRERITRLEQLLQSALVEPDGKRRSPKDKHPETR